MCSRIRNWVVACAASNKDIPPVPQDWWKHEWKGPPLLTADVAKVNKENREDIMAGLRTEEMDADESGLDWQEIQNQVETEARDRCTRAAKMAVDFPWLEPLDAMHLLQKRDINRQTSTEALPTPEDDTASGKPEPGANRVAGKNGSNGNGTH